MIEKIEERMVKLQSTIRVLERMVERFTEKRDEYREYSSNYRIWEEAIRIEIIQIEAKREELEFLESLLNGEVS